MDNLSITFEVSIFARYKDMKGDAKCRNKGGLGYLWVSQGHWK